MRKRRITILFVIALLVIVSLTLIPGQKGKRTSVAKINAAIKAKGACWAAKENKFTNWTIEELKAIMGAFPEEIADIESKYPIAATGKPSKPPKPPKGGLPKSFDWRDHNGGSWVTPVRDQGRCGSCWAFGTVAQLESLILIFNNAPGFDLDLSEQFIVSCDTSNYGCNGGNMYRAYDFVRDTGIPDEDCFPYIATVDYCPPCDGADGRCSDWASKVKRIDSWRRVGGPIKINTNKIKEAVYENGPLSCGFDVYEDFFSYESGCYEYVAGPHIGGHAVCIIGWTAEGCWIVKNSWGNDWGENGFFQIKFGNCRIGRSAGKFKYTGSN